MSGIYIPGMEMPKSCNECRFFVDAWCYALEVDDWRNAYNKPQEGKRLDGCPLIHVPDHGRQDGLYSKYFVIKTETGEIVQDCFVLRPQKDKAAVAALLLYAEETESQELSSDIRGWLSTIIPASGGSENE